jgi:hypothetical protein
VEERDPDMDDFIDYDNNAPAPQFSSFIQSTVFFFHLLSYFFLLGLGFARGPTGIHTYRALGGDVDDAYDPSQPDMMMDDDIDNMESTFADIAFEESKRCGAFFLRENFVYAVTKVFC